MNNQDIYIDWSKAPEGTTHAYIGRPLDWYNGVSHYNTFWEKWEDNVVYQWSGHIWIYHDIAKQVDYSQRIKKPEEKVMSNNSLEQNIERMEKELVEMKVKLKAGEKWVPKGGDWFVDFNGKVKNYRGINLECSWFGTSFQTQEQAETASKLMRERNRIIQYVLEHEPNWNFKFVEGEHNYYINFNHKSAEWCYGFMIRQKSQDILMPKWVAQKLADDLNSGRVEL